ncbi:MAG: YdcF family protein [Bacteroidota bacterium]
MKDIIILLGSPNSPKGRLSKVAVARLRKCLEIFHSNDHLIICTGGFGSHFNTSEIPHFEYLKRFLMKNKIAEESFLPAANSSNTVEDATKTKAILSDINFDKCIIITAEYHVKRVKLIFDEILANIPKAYVPVPNNLSKKTLRKLEKHESKAIQGILTHGLYY